MSRVTVLSVSAVLVLGGVLAAFAATPVTAAGETHYDDTVWSFDATNIEITVFKPDGASAATPVPVVLNSHGWSGSRTRTATGLVGELVDAGLGVVTVDARGHGASGGNAQIHNPEYEVRDFQAVLDHIATLDWVAVDADDCAHDGKDRVLGATGGSYGGGYQLMTASADCRLDALAPDITWNDLTYSLAPYGAPKAVWIDLLYGFAKQSGTRIAPEIDSWWQEIQVTNQVPAAAFAHLKESSPKPADIEADVLLTQGVADELFNLNDAHRNYVGLSHGTNDVRLVTHLGGHIIPAPGQPLFNPNGPARGGAPCGTVSDLSVKWMKAKLLGTDDADAIPEVGLAMEDNTCVALAAFPTASESVSFAAVAPPQGAGSVLLPLMAGPRDLGGIGTLTANAAAPAGGRFYASLVVLNAAGTSHVVDDQATGYNFLPAECITCAIEMDLGGVATKLRAGDQLFLRIDGLNEWSLTASQRTPAAVVLTDVTVTVPVLG